MIRTIKQEIGNVTWIGKNLLQEYMNLEPGHWLIFEDNKLDQFGNVYEWTAYRCYDVNESKDSAYRNSDGMITD